MSIFINCDRQRPDDYDQLYEVIPEGKSVFYIYFTKHKTTAKKSRICKPRYDHILDHKIIYEFESSDLWWMFIHHHSDENEYCRWDSSCQYAKKCPCRVTNCDTGEEFTVLFGQLQKTLYQRIPHRQIIVSTAKITFTPDLQPVAIRKQLSPSKDHERLVMTHDGGFLYFYEGHFDDCIERFYHYSYRDRICRRYKSHWHSYRIQPSLRANSVHEFMNDRDVYRFFADEGIYYADCDQIAFPQCHRSEDYFDEVDWARIFYPTWVDTMSLKLPEQVFAMIVMLCDDLIALCPVDDDKQK